MTIMPISHVRKRCSAHYLHALIQPQIRGLEVQAGTIHHALGLLQQRCPGLETLSLTGSTSANPELFIPVFRHFPNLTKIDLNGNIMDDRAFDSIGQVCHRFTTRSKSTNTKFLVQTPLSECDQEHDIRHRPQVPLSQQPECASLSGSPGHNVIHDDLIMFVTSGDECGAVPGDQGRGGELHLLSPPAVSPGVRGQCGGPGAPGHTRYRTMTINMFRICIYLQAVVRVTDTVSPCHT